MHVQIDLPHPAGSLALTDGSAAGCHRAATATTSAVGSMGRRP
ncbi:hypothetical protein [Streptomyces sp. NBC_00448]